MTRLSQHFTTDEFRDHQTGEVYVVPELVWHLELLRSIVGRPLVIVSGYRSKGTNAAVGGARRSQHLTGRAADLQPGVATAKDAIAAGFTGVGIRNGWAVHVDVRPGRTVTFFDPPH